MLTVKCSACSVPLKLKAAPPNGKIKCPKCGAVISVGKPTPSRAKRASVSAGSLDPDDEGFDFSQIKFPSSGGANAITQFPSHGQKSVYDGPIPGDPLEFVQEEDAETASAGGGKAGGPKAGAAAKGAKKRKPILLLGIIAGLLLLVIGGVIAFMLLGGG
jgi:hypothetical protein